ncbi:Secreted repeat of unknown function [Acidothermus cellulolyticus 11B]|jgi:predicted lipoprotein with Yx(FWY)xxD motif|uniref:Lipoprotein n=1 Tax=Acidothermus cellulolyticus (strain ATCC 43068 / DSM 8971 / 11B) TaxID=351607 RepID=A0LQU3_ACIC1|nr:hypothetical protein [Acidothermus cellulolyticus]ABK51803.1 Secreted repeat of unknown function [Acidothermus cellulolyticus 11B]
MLDRLTLSTAMRARRPIALAAVAFAALLTAGCSSSSYGGGSTASTSTAQAAGGGAASSGAASAGAASAGAAVVGTATGPLGTYLVDGRGMTLYLWDADRGTASTCYNACAKAWPPLLTNGAPTAAGGADASKLGVSKRTDGTTQVTYNGHPLYYFYKDTKPGEMAGQGSNGFGAPWWIVAPSGTPIITMPSSSGGYGYNY